MNRVRFFSLMIVIIGCVVGSGLAQDSTCPAIVEDALAAVDSWCNETGRNQACYGNLTLTAEVQVGVENLQFETPGDIVNVADIQSLALSPLDETAGEWGVSLMKLQANLPETLPGQNVTVLLFGDVELTAAKPINDKTSPMQAIYLRTGIGDAPCNAAPNSGVLIQTPEGVGKISLTINEVNIELGSTGYFQAEPGQAMRVSVVEGEATIQALGESQTAIAGTRVDVAMDENLAVAHAPTLPESYNLDDLQALPTQHLPRPIEVSPPLEQADLWTCEGEGGQTVTAGAPLTITIGVGRWDSPDKAAQAMAYASGHLELNGVSLPLWKVGPVSDHSNGNNQFGFHLWFASPPLQAGTYTISGGNLQNGGPGNLSGNIDRWGRDGVCVLTVVER